MKRLQTTVLAYNHNTQLCTDVFEHKDGQQTTRTIVRRPDACAVIVYQTDAAGHKHVFLARQAREAVDEEALLELPAGKIDPGEEPETAADRELQEEMGMTSPLTLVHTLLPSPGYTDERIHVYVATDPQVILADGQTCSLHEVDVDTHQWNQRPDEGEQIEIVRMDVDQALSVVQDAKTLIGLYYLKSL